MEKKANAERARLRAAAKQQALPNAAARAALKEKLRALADVSLRFGTGSLEGIGMRMAQNALRTSACGYLIEGSQFIRWLVQELGINTAIATQLWERMCWQRDTVRNDRSFEMSFPHLGVLGAVHLEDIWNLFANTDPLGLRSRLFLIYTRPSMKRSREIKEANDLLNNSVGSDALEEHLVNRFFPVYQVPLTPFPENAESGPTSAFPLLVPFPNPPFPRCPFFLPFGPHSAGNGEPRPNPKITNPGPL